jgi:adenylosuccinate lyase
LRSRLPLRIDDPGVRALFTEAARFQSWLDVEAALAQAQAELGIIPEYAAREIVKKAHLKYLDLDAVRAGLAKTGHPIVPLVWALDRACEGDAGGYVHWGATTQNITQTGLLLQVRRAHQIFLRQLGVILGTLADLAERTKDDLLPGRTHGQHAVPATFGFKVAVWIDELCRHVERLRAAEGRVFVAMLGGGAGTLASLGEPGLVTQEKMAARLGMRPMSMPARTIGDHQAEYVTLLGSPRGHRRQDRARDLHPDEAGVRRGRGAGAAGYGGQQHDAAEAQSQAVAGHHRGRRADPRAGAAGARRDAHRARGRPHHEHHDGPRATQAAS